MSFEVFIPALTGLFGAVLGSLITWMIAQRRMQHEAMLAQQQMQHEVSLQAFPRVIEALEALWEVVPHIDVGSDPDGVLVQKGDQVYLNRRAAEALRREIAVFFRSRHSVYIPTPVREAVFTARDYMMETLQTGQGTWVPLSHSRARRIRDGFDWARGRIRRTLNVLTTDEILE